MSGRRKRMMCAPRGPINPPKPYRDRSTGETTVDALAVLRHQVAVQRLEALQSRGYQPPRHSRLLGGGMQSPLMGGLGDTGTGFLFSAGMLGRIFSPNDAQAVSFIQIPSGGQPGTTTVHDFTTGGLAPQMVAGPGFRFR